MESEWDSHSLLLMSAAADRRGLSAAARIGYLCTDDVSLQKSIDLQFKKGGARVSGVADGFICPSSTVAPKKVKGSSQPSASSSATASGSATPSPSQSGAGGSSSDVPAGAPSPAKPPTVAETDKSKAHANIIGQAGTHEAVCLFTSFSEEFSFPIGVLCAAGEDTLRTLKQVKWLVEGIALLHAAGFEVHAIVNDNGSINVVTRRTFTCCESFTESTKTTDVKFGAETADFSVRHPIHRHLRLFFLPDQVLQRNRYLSLNLKNSIHFE